MSGIYGDDGEEEPPQKVRPTGLQGGGSRNGWPAWAREGLHGGSSARIPIPELGSPEASPFYRKPVPRHAVDEGGRGRFDAASVPADLVQEMGQGGRSGGPIFKFPEDPRNPSNFGARDRRLKDETVVWAAMHDPTVGLPDYLGGWLYARAELFGLEPPDWLFKRLERMAHYPGRHQQAAYRLYVWCGELVAEMRRPQPPRR